ncbi:MAG TPA: ABC transporter permease [Terriglobales bacterium]|nr:ABC transporter permease [Terriglobales bacterium]
MKLLASVFTFLSYVFRRGRIEHEMDEEFRSHLASRARDLERQGSSLAEAERQARIEFGGYQRYKEECREALGTRLLQELCQDLHYGLRQLRRNPGFTAVAVITLALGIGANTAIFSVVDAVLLRPLPFPQPNRIVQPMRQYKSIRVTVPAISAALFDYWKAHNRVFSHLAAFSFLPIGFNLAARGLPERVPGVRVSADFFKVLGVSPFAGRTFSPAEDRPGGERVVVLGYNLWQARFGRNKGVVGRPITIDGQPYTVVGIMPPGFQYPIWSNFEFGTDLWTPLQLPPQSHDQGNNYAVLGRLNPDVTASQAAASLTVLTQQLRKEFPGIVDEDASAAVVLLHEQMVGNVRSALLILMAAVGLVLLIACVNVANLMLSRATVRRREIAVRTALGAGRGRIIRQLTAESVLLALLGGALGLLVAVVGARLLIAMSPVGIPHVAEIGLDWRVMLFALAVSCLTGVLFGVVPALSTSRIDYQQCLKEGASRTTASGEQRRLSGALVVAETALSLMLLAGAGLLIASFIKLANVDPGFDPRHLLTFETTLPEAKYGTPTALATFYREVLQRLNQLPGVEVAANITALPTEMGPDLPFIIEGRTGPSGEPALGNGEYRIASPEYLRAMRIPLIRGRFVTTADTAISTGVVVINQAMARQLWPGEEPLGQIITIGKPMGAEWTDRPRQVVGVVGDVKNIALNEPARPEMYVPYTQVPPGIAAFEVKLIPTRWVLRIEGTPHGLVAAAGTSLLSVDPNVPIASVKTMDAILSGSIGRWRFNTMVLGIFAGLALLLAAVGLYGVLSYSVAQRIHEIGIRTALGAEKGDVLRMIIGQGLKLAFIGVAIGIAGALVLTRFLSSLLYGVKPTDPLTFAAVSLILIAVALLACYIPARRAAKVDPMVALRYE